MKVFQDLEVVFQDDGINQYIDMIINNLPNGWQRDLESEDRIRGKIDSLFYIFHCIKEGNREEAIIAFFQKEKNSFYISNISPRSSEIDQLTEDQYNIILNDFCFNCLKPLEKTMNFKIILSNSEQTLEDWISQESAQKLIIFSNSANKSTGNTHPSDQIRWFDFIISYVNNNDKLDIDKLYRWFTEDEDWLPNIADKLISDFEYGTYLLRYFMIGDIYA